MSGSDHPHQVHSCKQSTEWVEGPNNHRCIAHDNTPNCWSDGTGNTPRKILGKLDEKTNKEHMRRESLAGFSSKLLRPQTQDFCILLELNVQHDASSVPCKKPYGP